MEPLHYVGGVDDFPDGRRVFEVLSELLPVVSPGLCYERITIAPFVVEFFQVLFC